MKQLIGVIAGSVVLLGSSAYGAISWSETVNLGIPDNVGATSLDRVHIVTGYEGITITDVNVGINISSQFKGDLYATLSYTPAPGDGSVFVVLLNRVGSDNLGNPGYGNGVFNVTFAHVGTRGDIQGNIHTHGVQNPTGYYEPDGRFTTPEGQGITSDPVNTSLTSFNGLAANGTWTLQLKDMADQDVSTLASWSLSIQTVPEPITTSLIILGSIFGCYHVVRYCRGRKLGSA